MNDERRIDHATRAALMRLRMAEYRIATLIAFRRDIEGGADAAAELSRAIAEPLVLMAAARWAAYLKAADESGSAAWEIASEKAAAIAEKIGRLR